VEGFYCQDALEHKKELILLYQDIRDVIPQGLVVNDHEVLVEPSELVRLKDIMALNFGLLGKSVVTASGEKIGKVTDYATEVTTMYVHKLYVAQSIFKNFAGGSLGVDRTQIVEITDKKIIIQDLAGRVPVRAGAVA
jgi:sporulation protein YlmC with PRC-barrel domain